jgi:mannosyltransferase OCH1-like enzyme
MWFDRYELHNEDPPPDRADYRKYSLEWQKFHPDWMYVFWNGDRLNRLWEDPRLARWKKFFYYRLDKHIEKCDFSRYAILYLYGGVYCDLDMICLRSLDPLMEGRALGLVYEPYEHCAKRPVIANGFMASSPDHWFWSILMDYIMEHYDPETNAVINTGPRAIAKMVEQNHIDEDFPKFFIPSCYILPMTLQARISTQCEDDIFDKAYCYTKWKEGTNWIKAEKLAKEKSITNGYMPICLTNPLLSLLVYIIYNKVVQKV